MECIKTQHKLINEAEGTHDNIVRDTFNAILSTSNSLFHQYFSLKIMAQEDGTDIQAEESWESATSICNNMKASSEQNKVDPKDAKIMALTTQVSKLEKGIKGDTGK